jgi:hypothetical protein
MFYGQGSSVTIQVGSYGKKTPMSIEITNGQNLSSRSITHETMPLDVTIDSHTNKVVFNVISSPKIPISIGLFWLVLHNPQVDWHIRNFHFETPQHKALECEILIRSMQNLEHKEDLDGTRRPRSPKLLFVRATHGEFCWSFLCLLMLEIWVPFVWLQLEIQIKLICHVISTSQA